MSRSAENRMIQASWSRKASALQHAPLDPAVLMCAEVPRGAIPLYVHTAPLRFFV